MGDRGPAPRRDAEVRRTNNKNPDKAIGPTQLQQLPFDVDLAPDPGEAPANWNSLVREFWEDLKKDPARKWMTSADWGSTKIVLEILSRAMGSEDGANGSQQTAFLKHLASIGVTEQARLRLQREVTLFPPTPVEGENVVDISSARRNEVQ